MVACRFKAIQIYRCTLKPVAKAAYHIFNGTGAAAYQMLVFLFSTAKLINKRRHAYIYGFMHSAAPLFGTVKCAAGRKVKLRTILAAIAHLAKLQFYISMCCRVPCYKFIRSCKPFFYIPAQLVGYL